MGVRRDRGIGPTVGTVDEAFDRWYRTQLTFEVEGRGDLLEPADDLVWEFTAAHRLHGDYGPHTRRIGRW